MISSVRVQNVISKVELLQSKKAEVAALEAEIETMIGVKKTKSKKSKAQTQDVATPKKPSQDGEGTTKERTGPKRHRTKALKLLTAAA